MGYQILSSAGKEHPVISIGMLAYNQEPYIAQAIESVLMQKTTYSYEIVIADDCSNDNTRNIILKYQTQYPEKIKLILQDKNVGASQNTLDLILSLTGRYVAALEADDYWTDPSKLQKQVDFLESNPEYVLCCHRYRVYFQNKGEYKDDHLGDLIKDSAAGISFDTKIFFSTWLIQPLTIVFRREAFDVDFAKKVRNFFDTTLFYQLMLKGKGYLFGFVGGVYRRHDKGLSTALNPLQHGRKHYDTFKDLYKIEKTSLLKEIYSYNVYHYIYTYVKINIL